MSNKSQTIADFEAQPLIEALILVLTNDQARDGAVYDVASARGLVERHFGLQPTSLAVAKAFERGATFGPWKVIGPMEAARSIEVNQIGLKVIFDALLAQQDSALYAMQKTGAPAFKRLMADRRRKAVEIFEKHNVSGVYSGPDVELDRTYHILSVALALQKSGARVVPRKSPASSSIDWAKSSAIATWIGVPLAVLAIIISLWIAGKI